MGFADSGSKNARTQYAGLLIYVAREIAAFLVDFKKQTFSS